MLRKAKKVISLISVILLVMLSTLPAAMAVTAEGAMRFLQYRQEAIGNALVIIEQLGEEDVCEFLRIIKRISDITNVQQKIELIDNQ